LKEKPPPLQNESNEPRGSSLQFMQELYAIDSNLDYKAAFDAVIFSVKEEYYPQAPYNSPESLYCLLREKEWKNEIPSSFFTSLLKYLIQQYLNAEKITAAGLQERIRLEHERVVETFSDIVPQEFKPFSNLDLAQFFQDTLIKDRLISEEQAQTHLPFPTQPEAKYIADNVVTLPKDQIPLNKIADEDVSELIEGFSPTDTTDFTRRVALKTVSNPN